RGRLSHEKAFPHLPGTRSVLPSAPNPSPKQRGELVSPIRRNDPGPTTTKMGQVSMEQTTPDESALGEGAMKLYAFEIDGQVRVGAEHEGRLVDLSSAVPGDMQGLIRCGDGALAAARQAMGSGAGSFAFEDVRLRAPLPRPGKILCSGVN